MLIIFSCKTPHAVKTASVWAGEHAKTVGTALLVKLMKLTFIWLNSGRGRQRIHGRKCLERVHFTILQGAPYIQRQSQGDEKAC